MNQNFPAKRKTDFLQGSLTTLNKEVYKMKHQPVKRNFSIMKVLLIIACAFLVTTGICDARGKKGEWKLPPHYPDGFDGYGCLMSIDKEKVVIDDSQKPLSPELTYHTPEGNNMPVELITVNSLVGYMIDKSNQIISIWLVQETCDR
jgi:hypothetical protein